MIKLGLTFSGGGGKGAYEIGVWKALKEFGIDQYVKAISGTSVGALNAALFIGGNYERAESTWMSISQDSILVPNTKGIVDYISSMSIPYAKPSALWLQKALTSYVGTGVFSQKGLEKLIRDNVDLSAITSSKIPIHSCAVNIAAARAEYIKLNDQSEADIVQYLLASAAIPFVFDKVEVQSKSYYDGGLPIIGDNSPIGPVIAAGCDMVIAVLLDQGTSIYANEQKYPNAKLWTIVPHDDQGGIIGGTLDFNPDHARLRITQGYEDTREQLQRLYEFLLTENKFVKSAEELGQLDRDFTQSIGTNKLLREALSNHVDKVRQHQGSLEYLLSSGGTETHYLGTGIGEVATIPMDKSVQEEIQNCLNASEKKVLSTNLDTTIEAIKDNSEAISALAVEGIAALSPVPGRVNYIMDQGLLKSIWNSIRGKNSKILAENQNSLYKAIHTNQELIKKLSEKNLLTMDILILYGNNFKYLQDQINQLNLNTSAVAESLQMLQQTVGLIFHELTRKFHNIDDRFKYLENRVEVVEWKVSLNGQRVNGTLLRNLPLSEKVGRVVSQLATFARSNSHSEYYVLLEAALADLDVDDTQGINPIDFCFELQNNTGYNQDFMRDTALIEPLSQLPEAAWQYFTLLRGVEWAMQNSRMGQEDFTHLLPKHIDVSRSLRINAVDFAVELFHSVNSVHKMKGKDAKAQLLDILEECKTIDTKTDSNHPFAETINELISTINHYTVKIPIIGPFSAGKSTLVNRYLQIDTLPTSQGPATALATEIQYAESEKVIIEYLDGTTEEIAPIVMADLKKKASEIAYIRLFLNHPKLRLMQGVILVDMPGLDSSYEDHNKAILNYVNRGDFFIVMLNGNIQMEHSVAKAINEITQNKKPYCILLSRGANIPPKKQLEIKETLSTSQPASTKIDFVELGNTKLDMHAFEEVIQYVKQNRQRIIVDHFKGSLSILLDRMSLHFEGLRKAHDYTLIEINQEIQSLEQEIEKVNCEIDKQIDRMRKELSSAGVENISDAVKNMLLNNLDTLVNSSSQGGHLGALISDLVRPVVSQELSSQQEKYIQKFKHNISSSMNSEAVPNMDGVTVNQSSSSPYSSAATTAMGSLAGFTVGRIILGPVVGLITAVVGVFVRRKAQKKAREEEIRMQIKGQVIPQALDQLREHLRSIINKWMDAFEKAMRKDIDEQVQLKLKTLEEVRKKRESREDSSAEDQKRMVVAEQETEQLIIKLNNMI